MNTNDFDAILINAVVLDLGDAYQLGGNIFGDTKQRSHNGFKNNEPVLTTLINETDMNLDIDPDKWQSGIVYRTKNTRYLVFFQKDNAPEYVEPLLP